MDRPSQPMFAETYPIKGDAGALMFPVTRAAPEPLINSANTHILKASQLFTRHVSIIMA
jgi:hypothetical protein